MSTTRETLAAWFDEGVAQNATHMVIAVDTFDYDDFPVFVTKDQDVNNVVAYYSDSSRMLKVMEVYDLSKNKAVQMSQKRAFNF